MSIIAAKAQPPDSALLQSAPVAQEIDWKRHVDQHLALYQTFAREAGFSVSFSEISPTCFDHERRRLVLNIDQICRLSGRNRAMFDYIVLHELGHLRELCDDPKGYRSLINHVKQDGLKGEVMFTLYNSLMDIYVNTNSANRAPLYASPKTGEIFSEGVRNLYRLGTFPKRDMTARPLCIQYAHALLNIGMETGDDLVLSPEVQQALQTRLKLSGAELSHQELIDQFLRPVVSVTSSPWRATIGQRKSVIDVTIRPIFEQLMEVDIQNGRTVAIIAGAHGTPVDLPEELLKEMERIVRERGMSVSDRAAALRKAQAENAGKDGGLEPEEARDFAESYQRSYASMVRLADLWRRLRDKSVDYEFQHQGYFRSGKLDVDRAIQEFPDLVKDPQHADVMTRNIPVEQLSLMPRRLWVLPVVDCSGSMAEALRHTRDMLVALAGSVAVLNREAGESGQRLEGQLSVLTFDDSAHMVHHRPNGQTSLQDIAGCYKSIVTAGGTADHTAYEMIRAMLTPDLRRDIARGEILPLLVELTDGDTSLPAYTKHLIAELRGLGVRCAGIRLGGMVMPDKAPDPAELHSPHLPAERRKEIEDALRGHEATTFNDIWGKFGYMVWSVNQIPDAMAVAVKDLLSDEL